MNMGMEEKEEEASIDDNDAERHDILSNEHGYPFRSKSTCGGIILVLYAERNRGEAMR